MRLCIQKLAQMLIKYGPKRVRFNRLQSLPPHSLEALLDLLVARNALNDNVLPHCLTRRTTRLGLAGASQQRRCVLNTIGRSCPNLRCLDVSGCPQVDNRIVRDVLQNCEHLETLRLEGCARISDSAFAPALWKPPLVGLLGLKELSLSKCGQITEDRCPAPNVSSRMSTVLTSCHRQAQNETKAMTFHRPDLARVVRGIVVVESAT